MVVNALFDEIRLSEIALSPDPFLNAGSPMTRDFRILGISNNPDSDDISFTWESNPEKTYSIEISDNLSDWKVLEAGFPGVPDNNKTRYTETGVDQFKSHFFRVSEHP